LDYADIRSVMSEAGKAMMGTGEAEGEDRAIRAAEAAISNPLLEDTNMKGARGLLINITGGSDVTLFEIDEAANRIRQEVDEDANIMVGMALDESLGGRMRISVVATGIDSLAPQMTHLPLTPKLQVVGGGVVETPRFVPNPSPSAVHSAPAAPPVAAAAPPVHAASGAGYIPHPPEKPLLSSAYGGGGREEPEAEMKPAKAAMQAVPAALRQGPEAPKRSLFNRVFGSGSSGAPGQREAARTEPELAPRPDLAREPVRPAVRPSQIDEIGLEIPAYLRRSTS